MTDITTLFPKQPQRQDALDDQISDMIKLGNQAGLYDAVDWVLDIIDAQRVSHGHNSQRWANRKGVTA